MQTRLGSKPSRVYSGKKVEQSWVTNMKLGIDKSWVRVDHITTRPESSRVSNEFFRGLVRHEYRFGGLVNTDSPSPISNITSCTDKLTRLQLDYLYSATGTSSTSATTTTAKGSSINDVTLVGGEGVWSFVTVCDNGGRGGSWKCDVTNFKYGK